MKVRVLHPAIGELAFPIGDEDVIIIGRDDSSVGIELNWDNKISRHHARVWVQDGELWLEDLGSTDGCWLNGERMIAPARITREVRLGDTLIKPSVEMKNRSVIKILEMSRPVAQKRLTPRFVAQTKVEIKLEGRNDFATLWSTDISKGGIFIETSEPAPFGTQLQLLVSTPDGGVFLTGTVVHSVRDSGMGVQFEKLDPEAKKAIENYVDGLAQQLLGTSVEHSSDIDTADLTNAREFLMKVSDGDLYGAVDVSPEIPQQELIGRLEELRHLYGKQSSKISPPVMARLQSAASALTRVERTLGSVDRRLVYDFRHGYVRSDDRVKAAKNGSGPTLAQLHQAWLETFPSVVQQASLLAAAAKAHQRQGKHGQALAMAQQALNLNPFDEEMHALSAQVLGS